MKRTLFILGISTIILMGIIQLFLLPESPESAQDGTEFNPTYEYPDVGDTDSSEVVKLPPFDTSSFVEGPGGTYSEYVFENLGEPFYGIYYYPERQYIGVSLLAEPIGVARELAEDELVRRFSVPKESLCSLFISVTTPRFVNSEYAGHELGISVCEGSVPLSS